MRIQQLRAAELKKDYGLRNPGDFRFNVFRLQDF